VAPGRSSAGAKRRQLFSQLREVSRLCGPGLVIEISESGTWTIRDPWEKRDIGNVDRYFTRTFMR
jgi:hypothetical protein